MTPAQASRALEALAYAAPLFLLGLVLLVASVWPRGVR